MKLVLSTLATLFLPLAAEAAMSFSISSPAFANNEPIPKRYTCEGEDISPALRWDGAPQGTKTFVLIVDDPDAPDPKKPQRTWVHWVLYNIPADVRGLADDQLAKGLREGTEEGLSDFKRTRYGGPCPPIGRHRYFHKLYALDTVLRGLERPTKAQLLEAMKGHVLAETQLIGTYEKGG